MRILVLAVMIAFAGAADAASDAHSDRILIQGNAAGTQTVSGTGGGTRVEYSYNDRGRGDHIVATWKLDAAGIPVEYTGRGNDYMKAAVDEHFTLQHGTASWNNRAEHGSRNVAGPAFYIPTDPPPEMLGVLARALLKAPDHRLALLPAGAAGIEAAGSVEVADGATRRTLAQYRISGLGFTPQAIWLDRDGSTAATVSGWFSVVPEGREPWSAPLLAAQEVADNAWSARLAKELAHRPRGDLIVRNARLFDPRDLGVTPGTSLLVRGNRIVRIAADKDLAPSADAEVIDAHGRFLMPGLWDNHQHFGDVDGMLDIAGGVTSARDMANDTDAFPKRVERFDAGTEIGPRVLKAGVIDGTGELAGPTKMRVDTAEQAISDVDWYADHGYVQIKI